ncbi:MAG TPA: tRNA preQ1(34) S-adenosylmethionine ribosyltransferase-isomerase QueA, partial [Candidatus Eisenbacteria bacterium]|nr:tRNA preQ1(34) S-adenosylmethionine ribosyltransferase-isomerase QueA [Candidatus Eisenbacteria bacterium]
TRFGSFPRYLREGDLLVVNETKVIPARIHAVRRTGGAVEVFLTNRVGRGEWTAMLRPARRISEGEILTVGESEHEIVVRDRTEEGFWRVRLPEGLSEAAFLGTFGHVPLPPYIKREDEESDRERYQTIFARTEGSVAAPTAGLHFTDQVLREISRRGVTLLPLTLHVGPGTFRPLTEERVEDNRLLPEFVRIRKDAVDEILEAKGAGRRVVAVGTTTTRALEAIAAGKLSDRNEERSGGEIHISGWTDLFIYPGYEFRIVDALLTNMHLPRSSLLLLVSAFAGTERVLRVYRWAVQRRFRFYSYGDVMFIA